MFTIDNQPVVFNLDKSCRYPFQYDQLVNQGDITQFQYKLEICNGTPQLLTNGSFTNGLTGWTQGGSGWGVNNNVASKSGTATGVLRQNILEIGKYYACEIDIRSINSDDDTNVAQVRFGASTSVLGLTVGVNRIFGRCLGTEDFELLATNNSQMSINWVTCFEVETRYVVTILDSTDTYVGQVDLEQLTSPYFNSDYFALTQDFVTAKINWNNLSIGEGCYKLAVIDPCQDATVRYGLTNGSFSSGQYGWAVISNITNPATLSWDRQFVASASGANAGEINYTLLPIVNGNQYTVTINVTLVNASIQVRLGSTAGTVYSSSGTFTETLTATGTNIRVLWNIPGVSGGEVSLDSIDVKLTNTSDFTYDFISEPLKIGSHSCTRVLRISNDVAAFGFDFTDFSPQIRVSSDLVAGEDESDREWIRNANGAFKTYLCRHHIY